MRPTLLTSLIVVQIVVWCILGTAVHGWQILCYPAAWLAIATGFLLLNRYHVQKQPSTEPLPAATKRKAVEPPHSVEHATEATANAN